MKRAAFLNLLVVGLVLTVGSIGCKKPQKGVTPIPAKGTQPPPSGAQRRGPTDPTQGTPLPPETTTTAKPIEATTPSGWPGADLDTIEGMVPDPAHFAAQTIYFEFDSSVVRTSQQASCNAVGDDLKTRPEAKVMIDGHCDERGTEEYNRALGERRAQATREYLIQYGIAPERVFTRSFGEDRPADPGHEEEAWSKNRRAEFILLLPPK